MRKVRKFRIPVYSYEVFRKARKQKLPLEEAGLEDQEAVKEFVSSLAASMEPSTVFAHADASWPGFERMARSGPVTVGILTLGRAFDAKVASAPTPLHKSLSDLSARILLEAGVGVVADLALQEAAPEGFELPPATYIHLSPAGGEPLDQVTNPLSLLGAALEKLEAAKAGVLTEAGELPYCSAVFALPWISRKRKKAAATPEKK